MNSTIVSKKTYILVWAALLVLLFLTWLIAEFNLGAANTAAALTIAVVKMLLVVLFFMHVRYNTPITWLFAAAGFVWLLIMITLTMTDYLTRTHIKPYNSITTVHELQSNSAVAKP
jgi:cytochrome c oxidase subunit 4